MFIAAQYYRPPFPNQKYWADDFARMRDAGLHAAQLWCIWGWMESEPGKFQFDDYDRLIDLATKRGLKIVLSTIGEIHPFWIHRVVPGSEMIDEMGHRVISSCRTECNVGLTPGGCTDHPEVAARMERFISEVAARYGGLKDLAGWDCWNETRWAVHADGNVCYCEHTVRAFRQWLQDKYGNIAGLNEAWRRRYCSWQDVMPGKKPERTYTEMMEFLKFLTVRATRHTRFRYEAIRRHDTTHVITAHCGTPAIRTDGWYKGFEEQALCRGVDWDLADQLDGFGCSHFPFWGEGVNEEGFGVRVESSRSAGQGKPVWVSELQGGSARTGVTVDRSVEPLPQQRWVANGLARGVKGIVFWCWRDEVFGRESSGFGFDGWDGLADARLAAMRKTTDMVNANMGLVDAYRPDPAQVGVLFTPENYLLQWADMGVATEAADGVFAYCTAMERLRIPYEIVESRHLAVLDQLKVLLMPWSVVLPPETQAAILAFVRRGGRVLFEAETASFDERGFYSYPNDRPFMQGLGIQDIGRRKLGNDPALAAKLPSGRDVQLVLDNLTTPFVAGDGVETLAANANGEPLLVRRRVGDGAAYAVGSFLGRAYLRSRNEGLEQLIGHVCDDAGAVPQFDVDAGDGNALLQWRTGPAGERRLLWIINGGGDRAVTITERAGAIGKAKAAKELFSGKNVAVTGPAGSKKMTLKLPAGQYAAIVW